MRNLPLSDGNIITPLNIFVSYLTPAGSTDRKAIASIRYVQDDVFALTFAIPWVGAIFPLKFEEVLGMHFPIFFQLYLPTAS